jgi:hypothetical protein
MCFVYKVNFLMKNMSFIRCVSDAAIEVNIGVTQLIFCDCRLLFDYCASYLCQCLDEVQSYILVERSLKDDDLGANSIVQEFLHVVSISFSFILFVLNVGTSEC